jgi:hypothetical protein
MARSEERVIFIIYRFGIKIGNDYQHCKREKANNWAFSSFISLFLSMSLESSGEVVSIAKPCSEFDYPSTLLFPGVSSITSLLPEGTYAFKFSFSA